MAVPSKQAAVVVWDIGPYMAARVKSKDGEALFEDTKTAIASLALQKMQYSKQDELGVVLMGTAGTHNTLAHEYEGEYQHITVVSPIVKPSADTVRAVGKVRCEGASADLMDSLVVAADMLQRRTNGLRFSKRIFLFTSAADDVSNKDDLEKLLNSLKANDISLVVVGIEFRFETAEQAEAEESWESLDTKSQNEKVLHYICSELGGESVVAPVKEAIKGLTALKTKTVLQRTAFRACLEIGEEAKIPLWGYLRTKVEVAPALSRMSVKAQALAKKTNTVSDCKVDIERRYFCPEDNDREVDDLDRVKAFQYGSTIVPLNEIDAKMLQFDGGERGMKVLAFVPRKSVRRHHLMSHTYCLVAPAHDAIGARALSAFLQAMFELDQAMIVRLVRFNHSNPVMCIAWPHLSRAKECLFMNEVPFSEDIRRLQFRNVMETDVSKDQMDAWEQVIKNMDLMTAAKDESGAACEALKPKEVFNPFLQHIHQSVRLRLMKPDAPLPPLDSRVVRASCLWDGEGNILRPMFTKAQPHIDRLRALYGCHLVDKPSKAAKKVYWFADGRGQVELDDYDKPSKDPYQPRKKAKVDAYFKGGSTGGTTTSQGGATTTPGATASSLPSGSSPDMLGGGRAPASKVGTVTPVQDFKEMCARKDGDFVQAAIEGMCAAIKQLLHESVSDNFYEKAEACLLCLREGCVREAEEDAFNSFLRELKGLISHGKRQDFWAKHVVGKGVTLITDAEAEGGVSMSQAHRFLEEEEVVRRVSDATVHDKDDDLFDGLD